MQSHVSMRVLFLSLPLVTTLVTTQHHQTKQESTYRHALQREEFWNPKLLPKVCRRARAVQVKQIFASAGKLPRGLIARALQDTAEIDGEVSEGVSGLRLRLA